MIYIYMIYIYDIYIYDMIYIYIYIYDAYIIYMWCHVYIWYVMGGLFERGIPVLGGMEWHGKSWWTIGFGASQFGYNPISTGLVWGKICRKPWFLPSNIGLSCKFSHNPILWHLHCLLVLVWFVRRVTCWVVQTYLKTSCECALKPIRSGVEGTYDVYIVHTCTYYRML